jgi:c-di-GMP-binding flagellar brake protein YcgR
MTILSETADGSGLRQYRRRILNIPAQVQLSTGQRFEVRLLDVSEGGAGIVAEAAAPVGVRFRLAFQMPARTAMPTTRIELQARVVSNILSRDHAGYRIGLQFVDLDQAQHQQIRGYVAG